MAGQARREEGGETLDFSCQVDSKLTDFLSQKKKKSDLLTKQWSANITCSVHCRLDVYLVQLRVEKNLPRCCFHSFLQKKRKKKYVLFILEHVATKTSNGNDVA